MKKKIFIGLGIILIIAISVFFVWRSSSAKVSKKVIAPIMPTIKVDRGNLEKLVYAKGNVYEISRKEINPEIKKVVNKVFLKKGDLVKKGDIIFSMDDKDALLSLEKEDLNYEIKLREFEKTKKNINEATVYTPIEGRISKLNFKIGDKVEKDSIIAEITNPDLMELVAGFTSTDLVNIKVGQKANVFVLKYLDSIEGIVTKIDSHGKAVTGGGLLYDVTVRFTNKGVILPEDEAALNIPLDNGTILNSAEVSKVKVYETAKIKAKVAGVVSSSSYFEGDFVKKDMEIINLDVSENISSLKDMELTLRQNKLQRDSMYSELSKYKISATQDGIISEINVVEGQIPPSDKVSVVISGKSGLELRVKVDEIDIPMLKIGQIGNVQFSAYEDRFFKGTVHEINDIGKMEGTAVTYEVKLLLEDAKNELKVGMSGDVDVIVEKKENVLRLPVSSVNIIDNKSGTVMVKNGDMPKPVNVTIGLESDDFIEIVGGLKEGDEVLVSSIIYPQNMAPGMSVRAVG